MKSAARHHREVAKTEKRSWTEQETQAVLKGVERWGKGKWSSIKDDPDFGPILVHRTTIDIKDKYRNLITKKQNQSQRAAVDSAKPGEPSYLKPVEFEPEQLPLQSQATHEKRGVESDVAAASAPATKASVKRPRSESDHMAEDKTSKLRTLPAPATVAKDKITLTVEGEKRTLILNLNGATKASQLLKFVLNEFRLGDDYVLLSQGMGGPLDLSKPLKDQVPVFDLLQVVKATGK